MCGVTDLDLKETVTLPFCNMVKYNLIQIVTVIIGITLIFEGVGSLLLFNDQSEVFQAGRIFRIISGFVLVFVVSTRIK